MKPFFAALTFFLASPVAAQFFQPQLEWGTSLVTGVAKEYVLRNGTYESPVSRLEWSIPYSAEAEISAILAWKTPLSTSTRATLTALAPVSVGTLVDEDWNTGTLAYGRSEHEARLTSHWSAALEQEISFQPISLLLGTKYLWMSWEGWNGSGSYQQTNGTVNNYYFTGLLIAYRQQWVMPYLGLAWSQRFDQTLVGAQLRFGPYVWCNDMDNHNYASASTTTYLDYPRGGQYADANLEYSWPADGFRWGLRVSGELTWGAIGDTDITKSGQSASAPAYNYSFAEKGAGTWFREVGITVFVRN